MVVVDSAIADRVAKAAVAAVAAIVIAIADRAGTAATADRARRAAKAAAVAIAKAAANRKDKQIKNDLWPGAQPGLFYPRRVRKAEGVHGSLGSFST